VGLRYTLCPNVPLVFLYMSMPKKGRWPSFSMYTGPQEFSSDTQSDLLFYKHGPP
jgi:hypothetical protein